MAIPSSPVRWALHQRPSRGGRRVLRPGRRGHRRPAARRAAADGGWNCEAANGSTRSSFNTTICVLEALLEHERAIGASPKVIAPDYAGRSTSWSAASSAAVHR